MTERTRADPGTAEGETAPPPAVQRPAGAPARVVAGLLVALATVQVAVVGCFLVPLRIGTVPLPVCVPLAVVANVLLARLAARVTGWPAAAAVPPVLWLAVVLLLAAPRAEGDLVVPGTLTGLVFLFAGTLAGAYGAATTITRRRRPAQPIRG